MMKAACNTVKRKVFSVNGAGAIGYPHTKKYTLDLYLIPYTKFNSNDS